MDKIAASVSLTRPINGYERCHATEDPSALISSINYVHIMRVPGFRRAGEGDM